MELKQRVSGLNESLAHMHIDSGALKSPIVRSLNPMAPRFTVEEVAYLQSERDANGITARSLHATHRAAIAAHLGVTENRIHVRTTPTMNHRFDRNNH